MSNTSTVYVRGISKKATRESITAHFSSCGSITQLYWAGIDNPQLKGFCRIEYETPTMAADAMTRLNHSSLHGVKLSVRLDLGAEVHSSIREQSKRFICVPRDVVVQSDDLEDSNNENRKKRKADTAIHNVHVSYSSDGIAVNGTVYPTPRGLYLAKLLQLTLVDESARLSLAAVLAGIPSSKQAKELSETMSMVTGLWRLLDIAELDVSSCGDVCVYCLGDGKAPLSAVVLSLFLPSHVTFVSIDPLLDFDVATLSPSLAARLTLASCKSQDYCLSSGRPYAAAAVNVVVACHSHAPLQEFWDRLSTSSHPLRASAVDAATSTSADSAASVPGDIAADAVDTTAVPVSVILNSVAAVSCSSANASPALSAVEGHSDGSVRAAMRLCVSMPCCGKEWSLLPQLTPLAEYEDYEVFSARRRVFLYGDVAPTCKS